MKQVLVTYINGTPAGQFRRGLLRRLQTSVEVKYDALLTGKGVSDLNLNQINDPTSTPTGTPTSTPTSVSEWVLCVQWLENLNFSSLAISIACVPKAPCGKCDNGNRSNGCVSNF